MVCRNWFPRVALLLDLSILCILLIFIFTVLSRIVELSVAVNWLWRVHSPKRMAPIDAYGQRRALRNKQVLFCVDIGHMVPIIYAKKYRLKIPWMTQSLPASEIAPVLACFCAARSLRGPYRSNGQLPLSKPAPNLIFQSCFEVLSLCSCCYVSKCCTRL